MWAHRRHPDRRQGHLGGRRLHPGGRRHQRAQALAEVRRLAWIAELLPAGHTDEAVWAALNDVPQAPPPGWRRRMTLRTSVDGCHVRPYGLCWHLRHYPFFAAAPVPFVAVSIPGGAAVTFEGGVRPDVAPIVRRFAVDGVAEALGLCFPEDLRDPVLWAAVWELVLAGLRELTTDGPDAVAGATTEALTDVATGHIELTGHWEGDPAADRLRLSWAPHRLALRSHRFGDL